MKAASPALYDAYWDFILSRQAMIYSDQTLEWYRTTLGMVLGWMVQHGIFRPEESTSRIVRNYLADMSSRGLSDSNNHNHARVIRTLLLFWHVEKYIAYRIVFPMPEIAEKRMRFLTAPEVKKVIDACSTKRDKALVLVMVDSGVRRSDLCALNWQDVNIASGLITILHGKGGQIKECCRWRQDTPGDPCLSKRN